ncbi:uncharacterized protein LOC134016028 [Osmerus eperlanus]|uniref:uncharacterized protein LOC134016028 n=1 Tax=Osmerus eperlanus TaxID=29151 RepID=UPI002E0F492C
MTSQIKYAPSKFQDIISRSFQIHPGPPARYQLVKKESLDGEREGESRLRRWTFGERDPSKVNKTILLVGGTGTGKSTMINALVNYVMGVEMEDKVWFEIVEEGGRSQSESQTSEVTVYQICGFEEGRVPFSLTIIDTPGYDSTGESQNTTQTVAKKIQDLVMLNEEINAVALVVHADLNRQQNIFHSVLDFFGKDMGNNIVFLITHSDGMSAPSVLQAIQDANIKCRKNDSNQPVHFQFNNSQNKIITDDIEFGYECAWKLTMRGIKGFLNVMENAVSQKLQMNTKILREKKLKDIISRSSQIHSGPPARYQLKTQKESLDGEREGESRLRRWTFGERDHSKDNKTILLVGETGTGKSTMINALVNYVMGVEMEDKVWFEIVEEGGRSQSESQTSEVTVYQICGFEEGRVPFSLTIIDTPGYEIQNNIAIVVKLLNLFKHGAIQQIDAVGLLIKSSTNCVNAKQKNIFEDVSLAEDMEKNIVFLMTHSDGMPPTDALQAIEDADIKCAKDKNGKPVHFLFNNHQNKVITEETDRVYEFAWNVSEKGIEGFFTFLKHAKPQRLQMTVNVWKDRKFKGNISQSKCHPGPPARYQLVTKRESLDGEREGESRLRRWTFGERDHSKDNKTILLVGQTGTGKSTMINALVNYVMGVEFDDEVWFEIIQEEKICQTKSQTSTVTVYETFGFEGHRVPYSLTIIDTPGFGDTEGVQKDEIFEKLHDLFRSWKGIREIDAVGFLVKADTNRLDDKLRYVFDAVVSLFGKDMKNNIVFLITYSDGMQANNALKAIEKAKLKCAKCENGNPVNFLFNNNQTDIPTEKTKDTHKFSWRQTMSGMDGLFNFLNKTKPQKLSMTVNVMTERIRLKACIGNLKDRLELIDLKQTEIQQKEKAFTKHKEEMERVEALFQEKKDTLEGCNQAMQENQNFEYEVHEPYKVRVPIDALWDNKAVTCLDCEENCHYPGCTLAINPSWCEVLKKDHQGVLRCTSCTGKCTVDKHVKEKWSYVNKTKKVKKNDQEKKTTYENNKQNKAETEKKMRDVEETKDNEANAANKVERELSGLMAEKENLERDKIRWVEEAYQHVVRLEEIALNAGSLFVLIHLDFLTEKMKETGDQEKVLKLEEMKTRAGEGREQEVTYMRAGLKKVGQAIVKNIWGQSGEDSEYTKSKESKTQNK